MNRMNGVLPDRRWFEGRQRNGWQGNLMETWRQENGNWPLVRSEKLCLNRLRKDAASGVNGVRFQEYEKNLEGDNGKEVLTRLTRCITRLRSSVVSASRKVRLLGQNGQILNV